MLLLSFRKKQQWHDIALGLCAAVNQVSKKLCFILMVQAYGSIDFDDLFVSISILTLSPDFAFCQVDLRCMWYPLDAILVSNEYILLTCYDTKKRSLKDFCHKISKIVISEFSNSNAKQKQTGNWNYGYDLYLTFFLPILNTIIQ